MIWQQESNTKYLPIDQLRELSRVNQTASIFYILWEYVMIAAVIYLCVEFRNPLLYVFAVIWIGSRQHALGVIGHDGIHYLLFKNKKLNDRVVDLFLFWPTATAMKYFRYNHNNHHNYLMSDNDPELKFKIRSGEFSFPMRILRFSGIVLTDLLGITLFKNLITHARAKKNNTDLAHVFPFERKEILRYNVIRLLYYSILITISIYFNIWVYVILFWIIPFLTWQQFTRRVRLMADHTLVPESALMQTSVVIPNWFDDLFMVPHNFGYHLPHHLFISIPFYRLPRAHHLLMQNPLYAQQAFVVRGYWKMLWLAVKNNQV